ncbi:response regulator [Azospirillum sp. ST 5-10]|uniref:response regulator n=1 Tax=unclassified Azospirillum TaxID=2630922 RepID=UPI003F4A3E94
MGGEPEPRFRARDILLAVDGVAAHTPCGDIVERLLAQPDLPCLAVVGGDGRPLGLVERERLLATFADRIKSELYRRRPIAAVAERAFLAVDAEEGLDAVSAAIAGRHPRALASGFVITDGGRYAGIGTGIALLSNIVDLTRSRAAQLAAAGARAEAASRAKSAFLAAMSHEIRTPLHGVIGSLDLLRHAEDAAERDELAGAATAAAHTLLQIIGDVLDFSKIESDRVELEIAALDPAAVVREAAALFASKARQRDVVLGVHVGTGVPRAIRGDALRLRQIAMNFIGNAVKFTERGTVTVSLTRVWGDAAAVRLRLEVADTGPGFAPEMAPALFDAFVQESGDAARRHGGTGLGLAIARRLVGLMGGAVGADGEPGQGATFWCEIPVDVAEPAAAAALPDLDGLRVLVFDGGRDGGNRAVGPLLEGHGARVVTVDGLLGGIAALRGAAADGQPFDVVVLDWHLPDGDRFVIAELLAGSPSRLLLTAPGDEPALARAAYRRGFVRVVAGPCPADEVAAAVAVAAGRTAERTAAPSPGPAAAPVRLAGRGGGLPVLVIDDTPMNLVVAQRQLRRLGLDCEVAADGREGLALATSRRYALILVDRAMPVVDGAAFVRRLRAWEAARGRRTPVIAMTAHAQPEDERTSLDAGMDDHLTKPVTLDRLAAALARWLDPEAPAAAPVDLARLAATLGGADPAELGEVLDCFVRSIAPLLERLRQAAAAGDRTALRDAAHAAKGAARNAAAGPLGDLLAAVEADAATAAMARLAEAAAQAGVRFAAVEAFVAGLQGAAGSIHSSATPS